LARFRKLKSGWIQSWIWGELVLGSQNNTPDETNGINNVVICCKEAEQQSIFSVTSLLPVLDKIFGMAMNFKFFRPNENCKYTVFQKKEATKLLAVTLSNLNQF